MVSVLFPWTIPDGQESHHPTISTLLLPSKDGGLWIGTSGGLAHWTGQDLINLAPSGRVDRVIVDSPVILDHAGPGHMTASGPYVRRWALLFNVTELPKAYQQITGGN